MKLKEWLFSQRLSVTYLAGLLKLDRSYIHKWIRGQHVPSQRVMDKIKTITLNQVTKVEDLVDEKRAEIHRRKKRNENKAICEQDSE